MGQIRHLIALNNNCIIIYNRLCSVHNRMKEHMPDQTLVSKVIIAHQKYLQAPTSANAEKIIETLIEAFENRQQFYNNIPYKYPDEDYRIACMFNDKYLVKHVYPNMGDYIKLNPSYKRYIPLERLMDGLSIYKTFRILIDTAIAWAFFTKWVCKAYRRLVTNINHKIRTVKEKLNTKLTSWYNQLASNIKIKLSEYYKYMSNISKTLVSIPGNTDPKTQKHSKGLPKQNQKDKKLPKKTIYEKASTRNTMRSLT